LNGLVIGGGMLACFIPGIFLACRLLVCVPIALIEKRPPGDSLSRSFQLTKGFGWRSFMILAFFVVLVIAVSVLFSLPFVVMIGISTATGSFEMLRVWQVLQVTCTAIGEILVTPIPLIANSVYYYDLRVRKEAFDLQFMLNPDSQKSGGSTGITSIL